MRAEQLALRPWLPTDAPALAAIADDPLMVQWSPLLRGDEGVEIWIEKRLLWTDHMSWAIVDDADAILGGMSVFQFDAPNANAVLGYWVSPLHRGNGIAPRAAVMAAEFAFAALPIERITLFHAIENEGSCRVANKAGFTFEGTTRKSWRYVDGNLHDEHIHALLRTDLH